MTTTLLSVEQRQWREARTLEQIACLTAAWLRGKMKSQPGYWGSVDVDEAEAPGLTETLLLCNYRGFLTRNSQAGCGEHRTATGLWRQRASVTGFVQPWAVDDWARAIACTPYLLHVTEEPTMRTRAPSGVVVTYRNGKPYTTFGRWRKREHLAEEFDGLHELAVAEVLRATEITIYDPDFGPNALWEHLRTSLSRTDRSRVGLRMALL